MDTCSENPNNGSSEVEYAADTNDVWVELKRGSEGVSLTVYEQTDDNIEVVDETWWTWAEFTGIDTAPLPISASGTVALNAVPTQRLLTAESVMETVEAADYRLANVELTDERFSGEPLAEDVHLLDRTDAVDALEHQLSQQESER